MVTVATKECFAPSQVRPRDSLRSRSTNRPAARGETYDGPGLCPANSRGLVTGYDADLPPLLAPLEGVFLGGSLSPLRCRGNEVRHVRRS